MNSREGAPNIEELLRNLGREALIKEAEVLGLSPRNGRMKCPFPGCSDKKDRERDAQVYAGEHPRVFCFRCQTKGDLLDLLQLSRGLSTQDAIAYLSGIPVQAKPQLRVVPTAPSEDPDKLSPAEARRLWDGMALEDEAGQEYLQGRGLEDAVELGMVRFATEKHPDKGVASYAKRGYRIAVLLSDVVGNARGIQLRRVGEPRAKEPKILSVKGSSSSRAFFGAPDELEGVPVVAVAEGLADTLALGAWTAGRPELTVVGAAGKSNLPKLADGLEAAGIQLAGKVFALFPQNDRPKNVSRREFVRLGQLLTKLGARVVLVQTDAEFKDLAEWRQARPELAWPPPELQRAVLPDPGDDSPREHLPVLPTGCAVPIPAEIRADSFAQDFTTLCTLLDDPVYRQNVAGDGSLTWCEMTHQVRLGGRELADTDLSAIRLGLESQARSTDGKPLKFGEDDIAKALKMLARRKTVHPVRDWLLERKWDGRDRIDTELPGALGQEAGSFQALLLRRWMLAAVARPMKPGCKVDTVLVLVGPRQGTGKSSFFSALAGDEWFTDSPVNVGDRDGKMLMRKKWIVEWAELDAMRRARDKEAIRAFLAQRIDDFREPYGKGVITAPRGCVIVGTTNDEDFLHEYERRFLPIAVHQVDLDWVRKNREQLWAEAVRGYQAANSCADCGQLMPDRRCSEHRWWLEPDELAELEVAQQDHQRRHPWTELVEDWLESKGAFLEVTATQVLIEALRKPEHQLTNGDQQQVGAVLRQLGWDRKRRSRGGSTRWVYVRRE